MSSSLKPHYTDKQKLDAVTLYLTLGSVALTAATLKISERTIWLWKRTDWWADLVNEIKKEDKIVLSSKLRKIVDKSWSVMEDRMENGDWVLNQKTGELQRKPASLRDVSTVAFQAAQLVDKFDKTDSFVVATEQIEEKLNKLAQAFADLSKGKKTPIPEDVIDAVLVEKEDTNALHEERQA